MIAGLRAGGAARYNCGAMCRAWLALAVLSLGIARGAAPSYSAAGIVNASNFTPGPFAPNSILALFGTGLATSTYGITGADIKDNQLPTVLSGTRVYVGDNPAPLFFVSDGQVNLVLSGTVCYPAPPCTVVVYAASNSNRGPDVAVNVVAAAPALFTPLNYAGYATATHGDSANLITPDSPAHTGDIAVIYATGLGRTQADPAPGELPNNTSPLSNLAALRITLGGLAIDASTACTDQGGKSSPCIQYAGLTPLQAGLYQINLTLPAGIGTNPEIRVYVGDQGSAAGVKLAVQ